MPIAKLQALVEHRRTVKADGASAEISSVVAMLKMATMPALEAVQHWGVTASPYVLEKTAESQYIIRHPVIGARVARTFTSLVEAQAAVADLVIGKTIEGEGDFKYFGQPMVVCPTHSAVVPLQHRILH